VPVSNPGIGTGSVGVTGGTHLGTGITSLGLSQTVLHVQMRVASVLRHEPLIIFPTGTAVVLARHSVVVHVH
jgi:hypothetical protein